MPRDYAKTKSRRKSSKARKSSPVGLWINTGLLVMAFVAALIYLQRTPPRSHDMQAQQSKSNVISSNQKVASTTTATAKTTQKSNKAKPQFDFYTILSGEKTPGVTQAKPTTTLNQPTTASSLTSTTAAATTASAIPTQLSTPAQANVPPNQPQAKAVVLPPPPMLGLSKNGLPTATTTAAADSSNSSATEVKNVLDTLPQAKKENQNAKTTLPSPTQMQPNPSKKRYLLQIASVSRFEDADRLKAQLTLLGFDVAVQTTKINNREWHRINLGPYPSVIGAKNMQKQLASKGIQSILINLR